MTERPTEDQPIVQMSVEECWDLLESHAIGRLGYRLTDEVHIVPINYVVDGHALLFSTAPGSKLFASELHTDVGWRSTGGARTRRGLSWRAAICATWLPTNRPAWARRSSGRGPRCPKAMSSSCCQRR